MLSIASALDLTCVCYLNRRQPAAVSWNRHRVGLWWCGSQTARVLHWNRFDNVGAYEMGYNAYGFRRQKGKPGLIPRRHGVSSSTKKRNKDLISHAVVFRCAAGDGSLQRFAVVITERLQGIRDVSI
jgi:hypothetical protein